MWVAVYFSIVIAFFAAVYVALAAYAVSHGASPWAFVIGLPFYYLLFPLAFTTVWMLLGWWWRAPRPASVELTTGQRARMFWDELVHIAQAPKMILYKRYMPDPPAAPATLPVLLVHGIGCNAAVFTEMRRYLEAEDLGPVYALSYGPPFDAIDSFAPQVAARIGEIEADTGARQVVIVAHSMGGLVARSYLRRYGGAHVRRIVTIGTPYAGSKHAWLMRGASVTQMRPGSAYLAALAQPHEKEAGVPIVSLWSWHDSMVTPQTSSRLEGHDNIVLSGVAHNAMLGDPNVLKAVAEEIRKARGAPTNESPASIAQRPSAPA